MAHRSPSILRVLLSILWISFNSVAQEPKQQAIEGNIYSVALFAGLEKMSKQWGHFSDNTKSRVPTDYRNMIVERSEITSELPTSVGIYSVRYLDTDGLILEYRKVKKEFSILIGHPAQVEGDRIKVTYTLHWVSYKKPNLSLGLSDWASVYFRLDSVKRKYVIDEVVLGGI